MIDFHDKEDQKPLDWASTFLQILPQIEASLQQAFRSLKPQRREEFVQDGVVHCLLAHRRLFEGGRADLATPRSLAHFAVLQVKRGREAGCPLNGKEPLSRYAQLRRQIVVCPLSECGREETWVGALVDNRRFSVADQVAARIDVGDWIARLRPRTRSIARDLALGASTAEAARDHGLSAARISQLRRELESSWNAYQKAG